MRRSLSKQGLGTGTRRVAGAALWIAAFVSQLPASASAQSVEENCARAQSAYGQAQFAEAARLYEACAKAQSANADAVLQEARALYEAHAYDQAQAVVQRFLTQRPDSAEAMYLLGHVLERKKQAKDSLAWFTRAAALVKPSSEDLRSVGLDYVLLDDNADAMRWLERAVSFDPKNAEAWYDLGRTRMTQGNYLAAEQALKTALQLQPEMVKAEDNLGVTYEAENRASDALLAYQTAIAWQRTASQPSEQPLLNLGTLLVTEQRGAEAIPPLNRAVVLAPGSVKAHEQLGKAYEQTGDRDKAIPQMELAVKLEPANARLHYQLGQMYRRAGETEKSRDELKRSQDLYGTHSTSPQQ